MSSQELAVRSGGRYTRKLDRRGIIDQYMASLAEKTSVGYHTVCFQCTNITNLREMFQE